MSEASPIAAGISGLAGPLLAEAPEAPVVVLLPGLPGEAAVRAALREADQDWTATPPPEGRPAILLHGLGPGAALPPDGPLQRRVVLVPPGEDLAGLRAVANGAFDFLPLDQLDRLPHVLRNARAALVLWQMAMIAERRTARVATTDPLTGLANRVAFVERTAQAVAGAQRGGPNLAVLYLDLDNFKDVNDTLGHHAGDELLQVVAARLRGAVRASDLVARLGGDEFAVLQAGVQEAADGGALAAKLRAALAAPLRLAGAEHRVSASIGIALGAPMGAVAAPELLRQADTALYRAKAEGRDRFCFFDPELDDVVRQRLSLAAELREALATDAFSLVYQPQVELPSGRLAGLEAFLRWHHPHHGMLAPPAFLPAALKSGLVQQLDLWVVEAACRQLVAWRKAGLAPVRLALNLSLPPDYRAPGFAAAIAAVLARHPLSPLALELEFDETALSELDGPRGVELRRLGEMGIGLVADRFGPGNWPLARLAGLGFGKLKLAPRLVAAAPQGGEALALLHAGAALAGPLGLAVAATGLEDAAQLGLAAAAGCALAQGYHLARPMPAEAVAPLLAARALKLPAAPAHLPTDGTAAAARRLRDQAAGLLANLPLAACLEEADTGRILQVNEAFAAMLGHPRPGLERLDQLSARCQPEGPPAEPEGRVTLCDLDSLPRQVEATHARFGALHLLALLDLAKPKPELDAARATLAEALAVLAWRHATQALAELLRAGVAPLALALLPARADPAPLRALAEPGDVCGPLPGGACFLAMPGASRAQAEARLAGLARRVGLAMAEPGETLAENLVLRAEAALLAG